MRARALFFSLALGLFGARAGAQPSGPSPSELERAKDAFRAGASAYAAGDYLAAIQALSTAYELTPLPAIAFSLAQAERRQYFVDHEASHLERAIELFRRYVTQVPRAGRRADALEALSQLEPLAARRLESKPAPAVNEAVRRTRVMVVAEAPGARIALDEAPPVASPLIAEVAAGHHRVRIEAPGFFPTERSVVAIEDELIFNEVDLRERPSQLRVLAPPGSDVYVDGEFAGRIERTLDIELASGPHRVAVARKGRRLAVRTVRLGRGEHRALPIELEPTVQRTASLALFISGGAALGTGLVLSAFAIRAENDAENFLGAQRRRNVSAEELHDYESAGEDRGRFRAASALSFAAAGGLFATAFFLHEFDAPDPREAARATRRDDAPRPAPEPRANVRFVPEVSAHEWVGSVRYRF